MASAFPSSESLNAFLFSNDFVPLVHNAGCHGISSPRESHAMSILSDTIDDVAPSLCSDHWLQENQEAEMSLNNASSALIEPQVAAQQCNASANVMQGSTQRKRGSGRVSKAKSATDAQTGIIPAAQKQRKPRKPNTSRTQIDPIQGNTSKIRFTDASNDTHDSSSTGDVESILQAEVPLEPLPSLTSSPQMAGKSSNHRQTVSKLHIKLGLTPADFLTLQSQAKVYMLDKDHPERQTCVGMLENGSTHQRLLLYHHTKDFLDHADIGSTYFGPGSVFTKNKGFNYPADSEKVVSLVMPLLRRVISNERQRTYVYAKRRDADLTERQKNGSTAIDISLPSTTSNAISDALADTGELPETRADGLPYNGEPPLSSSRLPPNLRLDIAVTETKHGNTQLKTRTSLPEAVNLALLATTVRARTSLPDLRILSFSVHLAETLKKVSGKHETDRENSWRNLLEKVDKCPWMDGWARVVVAVHDEDSDELQGP